MQDAPRTYQHRFEELTQVGSGSMGTVYKAWDVETQAHVALKLLHNTDNVARFEREGRVLSQITHPNIVRYVGHGVTPLGQPWLAMEWLDGSDLDSYLKAGALGPGDTIRLARALTSGLSWAHDRGFIHRDLKPSNVLIPPEGFDHAKVVDFGLARDVVHEDALTKTGMLIGTLEYMPPEQVSDAKRADARADVYSLGAVFFRCLTGVPPARGNSMPEILMSIIRGTIPLVSTFRQDVPKPFVELIASMLNKSPDQRPPSATLVALALDAIDGRGKPVLDADLVTEMTARPAFVRPPVPVRAAISVRSPISPRSPVSVRGPGSVREPLPDSDPVTAFAPTLRISVPGPPASSPAPYPHVAEEPSTIALAKHPLPRPPLPVRAPSVPPGARQFQWWTLGLLAVGVLALALALLR
jgi:serine/threonine protein kinase